jgi:(1->4)-alpha-D-glucan 1-alpha-D-glucosylmutase
MSERLPPFFPSATYRLQFTSRFRFADATAIVPYLHALGISHCYASPLFSGVPGSTHGYDVCDFNQLNLQLGTREEFDEFIATLRRHGMGLILDMVPNHMGGDLSNPWWRDVLEWGTRSRYAQWFDIDWRPAGSDLADKVLLPVLEGHIGTVLEAGKLKVDFIDGKFSILYYDKAFPVAPTSYSLILTIALEVVGRQKPGSQLEQQLRELTNAFNNLKTGTPSDPLAAEEKFHSLLSELQQLHSHSKELRAVLGVALNELNGVPGCPASFDRLFRLLQEQHYRLAFWRVGSEEINYRRFFDVTSLVSLRMELPEVFQAVHCLALELLGEGKLDGLRIDHPDGLYDPKAYFARLQESYARVRELPPANTTTRGTLPLYLVVEKILTDDEPLPGDWAVHGTTGYEFLNLLNGLFVDSRHEQQVTHIYKDFTGRDKSFTAVVYGAKKRILEKSLVSEVTTLAYRLKAIAIQCRRAQDFTFPQLRRALLELIAAFPVYRTYITEQTRPVPAHELAWIEASHQKAAEHSNELDKPALSFVRDLLCLNFPTDLTESGRRQAREFVLKFQQLTGPAMAKGLEDTAFYRYLRLASLNEVGGDPGTFGTSVEQFHRANQIRLEKWPYNLLATATHDTKRGEDLRAVINVISEMPEEWQRAVYQWREMNSALKGVSSGKPAPDANDEYLLFQTLLGAWPDGIQPDELDAFCARVVDYMLKAQKEAKQNTSWTEPNPEYETATRKFIEAVLSRTNEKFLSDFSTFQQRIAWFGRLNSLSQLLLKITSPGVPDFYQGTELWDLNLVDPDNRGRVDFDLRKRLLEKLLKAKEPARWSGDFTNSIVKLGIMVPALRFRREHRELFEGGNYIPLPVEGPFAEHVCAFARKTAADMAIIAAPRLYWKLMKGKTEPPLGKIWSTTQIVLPDASRREFRSVFTNSIVRTHGSNGKSVLILAEVLDSCPVALLN